MCVLNMLVVFTCVAQCAYACCMCLQYKYYMSSPLRVMCLLLTPFFLILCVILSTNAINHKLYLLKKAFSDLELDGTENTSETDKYFNSIEIKNNLYEHVDSDVLEEKRIIVRKALRGTLRVLRVWMSVKLYLYYIGSLSIECLFVIYIYFLSLYVCLCVYFYTILY